VNFTFYGIVKFEIDFVPFAVSWYGGSCEWGPAEQLGVSEVLQGGEERWVQG